MPDQRLFASVAEGDPAAVATVAPHTLAPGVLVASMAGILPAVGALIAIIFYLVQLWESSTVQKWVSARRLRRIAKAKVELARLEALELVAHPDNRVALAIAQRIAAQVAEQAALTARHVLDQADVEREAQKQKMILAASKPVAT